MSKKTINFNVSDKNKIFDFIRQLSEEMYNYMIGRESEWYLCYKVLTHSDVPFGKARKQNDLSKNLLYYITQQEMEKIEEVTGKPFETAKQTCIGLNKEFYKTVGLPDPREIDPYKINDYMSVKLVNSTMDYFNSKYTVAVFNELNKSYDEKWINNYNYSLSDGMFTDIEVSVAVHGLGMSVDKEFHKLRRNLFVGDIFVLLIEKSSFGNTMYILLDKNPSFYGVLNIANKRYIDFQKRTKERVVAALKSSNNLIKISNIEDEVTRQQQSKWRDMLSKEIEGKIGRGSEIMCPFTWITADYESLGSLFVASHIKAFSDPNTTDEEKYDINNGLLLSSAADALFDKHLITVSENKEIVFSFLIRDNYRLINDLRLNNGIYKDLLNDKRMEYLAYHRSVFETKELERKIAK